MNNIRASRRYVVDDDDDDYYGFVDDGATKTISPRQVDVGNTLSDGKFAVVKAGSLTVGNELHPVAVKMLKRTNSQCRYVSVSIVTIMIYRRMGAYTKGKNGKDNNNRKNMCNTLKADHVTNNII